MYVMTLKVEMRTKHQPVCCERSSGVGLSRARISLGLPKGCFTLWSWTHQPRAAAGSTCFPGVLGTGTALLRMFWGQAG